MAARSKVGLVKDGFTPGNPKKSRQGTGKNTKYAATSRNKGERRCIAGKAKVDTWGLRTPFFVNK